MVEMINSKYGTNMIEVDALKLGNEVLEMEKYYNNKCGFSNYSNDLPEFFRSEKLNSLNTVYDVSKEELLDF